MSGLVDPNTGVPIDWPTTEQRPPIPRGQGLRRWNYHDVCGTNLEWPPDGLYLEDGYLWCPRCHCPAAADRLPHVVVWEN